MASDLFHTIRAGVVENAEQLPLFGILQGAGGQQGGEQILFLRQDSLKKRLTFDVAEKNRELERLQKMETEAKNSHEEDKAEIAMKMSEIADLDRKIAQLKERIGMATEPENEVLDTLTSSEKI